MKAEVLATRSMASEIRMDDAASLVRRMGFRSCKGTKSRLMSTKPVWNVLRGTFLVDKVLNAESQSDKPDRCIRLNTSEDIGYRITEKKLLDLWRGLAKEELEKRLEEVSEDIEYHDRYFRPCSFQLSPNDLDDCSFLIQC